MQRNCEMNRVRRKKGNIFSRFFRYIYLSYIPNRHDRFSQVLVKILFLVCLTALIVSSVYVSNYFLLADKQDNIIDDSRNIWHSNLNESVVSENETEKDNYLSEAEKQLLSENPDFKGWIKLSNTKIDNPIYQAENNSFYLNHNQQKKKSVYGALYFDFKNKITEEEIDKNLVIYGHNMKNGSMFGNLKKLKNLNFYKENPLIEFSTLYKDSTYKIFAIFVLNANKKDDNGYIYNIYRHKFIDESDFDVWSAEAFARSIIDTSVDVEYGDNLITLVTCSSDFENARLVVMAREVREGESNVVDTSKAVVNKNPIYPEKWYKKRGIKRK